MKFLFYYIQLGTLTMNDCKMFKMYKTANILLSFMKGKSRKVLLGSGAAVQGGRGKLTSSKIIFWFACALIKLHQSLAVLTAFQREAVSLVFLKEKELTAVDQKELCTANFCSFLPKMHTSCCVVAERNDDSFYCSSTM